MKKWILIGSIAIASVTTWMAFFIYSKATDGFNVRQITSSLSSEFFLETMGENSNINKIFNYPLYYLGKGAQSYVFESEDHKYVVKFFKHKHLRSLHWLEKLRLPSNWVKKVNIDRDERIRRIFSSVQLSYEKLSHESGVVCVHLNKKPFIARHITLVDKLGIPHPIYLDDFQFVIQKKAVPLKQILQTEHEDKEIRLKIDQVCQTTIDRMKRGVGDKDRAVVNNMAYLPEEKRILIVDLGQLYVSEECSDLLIQKELIARLADMSSWANTHAPHILPFINEKVQSITKIR